MARRLRFKPTHKDILRGNDRAIRGLALMAGMEPPPELLNNVPDAKPRAAPRKLEAPVVAAISQLLAVHPRVIWAARFNSGAAGEFSHIWFHKFLRMPAPMRMPDFFGLLIIRGSGMHLGGEDDDNYSSFAIEAKSPEWRKPSGEREHEQSTFLAMIRKAGGRAGFARSADEAKIIIEASVEETNTPPKGSPNDRS